MDLKDNQNILKEARRIVALCNLLDPTDPDEWVLMKKKLEQLEDYKKDAAKRVSLNSLTIIR